MYSGCDGSDNQTLNLSNRFSPAVSPSLLKPEWRDLYRFKFNPAFELGIDCEFLDPEYIQCISCLDGIPDISVLLDDENEDPTTSVCSAVPEPLI